MDVVDRKTRSRMMSGIRGKNTQMEREARRIFRAAKVRFRFQPTLPGRPDFLLPDIKTVVFLDGCFWHKCPKCFKWPSSNRLFWQKKITGNHKRDLWVTSELKAGGYRVVRMFECRFWVCSPKSFIYLVSLSTPRFGTSLSA